MSALICPHCRVANDACAVLCHCCAGKLPEVPGIRRTTQLIEELSQH